MELKISNNDTSKRYLSIRRTVMALEVVESRSDDETTGSSNSTDNFCATRVNPVYEETREDADVDDEFGWDDEVMSPILESAPVPASDKQISDSIPCCSPSLVSEVFPALLSKDDAGIGRTAGNLVLVSQLT